MISIRNLAVSISWLALSTSLLCAVDLSTYRGFQLGMNLPAVEKLADLKPAEAKMIHQRPAVIEQLEWQPRRFPGSSPETDPMKDVLFTFFTGKRIKVAGEEMSFNHLEKDVIRSKFSDPRVHFALNCASHSCPPLNPEALRGD